MNQTLYAGFVVLGVVIAAYGARLLVTGRSYSFRGLTDGDTSRLQRAPTIYFRAIGATVGAAGLALINYGVLTGFRSSLPAALVTVFQILEFLLYAAVLVSLLWLLRLANRYKLFRWNKP